MDRYIRTEALLGSKGMDKLKNAKVILFGLGGVGGSVFETLIRSGIENIMVVDGDTFNETNLNRQILSTEKNIGAFKVEEAKKRAQLLNSNVNIQTIKEYIKDDEDLYFLNDLSVDYIIDAIDGFEGKISIIKYAKSRDIPIISSMGTGNKLDPTKFQITDIKKTKMCPLAKKVRKRLKEEKILDLKVIFSTEEPIKHNKGFIGSTSFVPPIAGIMIAAEVIKDILTEVRNDKRSDRKNEVVQKV